MFDRLRNILSGRDKTRALDAAAGGRRWRDDRRGTDQVSTVHGGASVIAARAAHWAMNKPEGTRIVASLVGNLVGTGITPRPQHSDETAREMAIHARICSQLFGVQKMKP
tara:strand:- start:803 stop:1132 length:330 start_codon:yes stop_codon:yes gene_type:complete